MTITKTSNHRSHQTKRRIRGRERRVDKLVVPLRTHAIVEGRSEIGRCRLGQSRAPRDQVERLSVFVVTALEDGGRAQDRLCERSLAGRRARRLRRLPTHCSPYHHPTEGPCGKPVSIFFGTKPELTHVVCCCFRHS